MSSRGKQVCALLAAQAACVAAGLWMNQYALWASLEELYDPHTVAAPTGGAISASAHPEGAGLEPDRQGARVPDAYRSRLRQAILPASAVTFLWTVALLAISTFLIVIRFHEGQDRERAQSASAMLRQTQELMRTRDVVIFALARLAGFRDHETGRHLERISEYVTVLATALRRHPLYARRVTPAFTRLIGLSSVLHDIGKVGIDDCILRKSGPLTPEERQEMERHTEIAGECLAEIARRMGHSDFLLMARDIAVAHHECWDGTGYPRGLSGEEIPLAARIVAIADVYDALATMRAYKLPLPHEQCVATITAEAGRHFDPELVKIWLSEADKFREISLRGAAVLAPGASRFRPESQSVPSGAAEQESSELEPVPAAVPAGEDSCCTR